MPYFRHAAGACYLAMSPSDFAEVARPGAASEPGALWTPRGRAAQTAFGRLMKDKAFAARLTELLTEAAQGAAATARQASRSSPRSPTRCNFSIASEDTAAQQWLRIGWDFGEERKIEQYPSEMRGRSCGDPRRQIHVSNLRCL
jgi:hypothetical protein